MKRLSAAIVALLFSAAPLCPDALVIAQAMKADTIAEIFIIDENGVCVELEIGMSDLPAFKNLLPDEIVARLGITAPPLEERLATFFRKDLKFVADGRILPGRVLQMEARRRVPRDEVTGVPLPVAEDEGEPVVFAELYHQWNS